MVQCPCGKKGQSWVYSGDYKWGTAEYALCRGCLAKRKDSLYCFKNKGRNLWYELSWILRWKNPHGHNIFTEDDMDSLGGDYPEYDFVPSDEQREFVVGRIKTYLENLPEPKPKAKRKVSEEVAQARAEEDAKRRKLSSTLVVGSVFTEELTKLTRGSTCASVAVISISKTGKTCKVIAVDIKEPDEKSGEVNVTLSISESDTTVEDVIEDLAESEEVDTMRVREKDGVIYLRGRARLGWGTYTGEIINWYKNEKASALFQTYLKQNSIDL